ncbi:phosphatases II [Sporormia fimetaria CBS 119925]|uniref:Phosphatases II n=1 Tax=Sporormia fimetaria CBS 119925 TaxID=1340428 RepID=A0A6A6V6A6_9PLEO|nr:phosphatases II [Sporormia fimetaria CBS 119925]
MQANTDMIRVSKVENVSLWRRGIRADGTLHLLQHHIVFSWVPLPPPGSEPPAKPPRAKQVWITYPIISHCVLRPSPLASSEASRIRLRCRDFNFFSFHFVDDKAARDVYESIRSLSCKLGRLDRLLAFSYQPQPPEDKYNGWEIYDARREYKRLGISPKDTDKGWRISEINKDYKFSETYPAVLVVPSKISDNVLNYAGQFRSRQRIPVLVYRHPINNCSITRSSQPQPGLRGNRNPQDEKLVAAIFATNKGWRTTAAPATSSTETSTADVNTQTSSSCLEIGDQAPTSGGANEEDLEQSAASDELPKVYGAQQRNMIVDARPTLNAMVMQAVGQGSEKMEYYPNAEKAYLGIDNIHVMRKSLNAIVEALKDSDFTSYKPPAKALASSGWLKHIDNILKGTDLIARTVGVWHSHVLIHCSDGWDRTSQLSALSQICLDPYYRTMEGFMVLVEKDWLSFGHMFRHRSGFLGSEKWFDIENERVERNNDGSGGGNPFENALRGARGVFNRQNDSKEALAQPAEGIAAELQPVTEGGTSTDPAPVPKTIGHAEEQRITKVNELSPVFHQFLDAVYQLIYQYPTRFEFNERFLRRLLYHLYSCQYGTFLFDNEKERVEARAAQRTRSVWDYFLCRREEFLNPNFEPEVDDAVRGKERMIFPKQGAVRWWAEVFGRADADMNASITLAPAGSGSMDVLTNGAHSPSRSGTTTPSDYDLIVTGREYANHPQGRGLSPPSSKDGGDQIVTGTETADHATGVGTTVHPPPNFLAVAAEKGQALGTNFSHGLTAGIASLGIKSSSRGPSVVRARAKSPGAAVEKEMEVEMQ